MKKGGDVLAEFDTRFIDIEEGKRIVSSVRVNAGGSAMPCSHHTVEIRPHGNRTRIVCLEQVAWLHGQKMCSEHEGDWSTLLDTLPVVVESKR